VNYIHQNENAIYYECGYSCDNAIFLKLGSENFFITDSRYELEAKEGVKNGLVLIERDLYRRANRLIKKSKIKKLKFDPKEWSIFQFENLSRGKWSLRQRLTFTQTTNYQTGDRVAPASNFVKLGAEAFDRFAEKILKRGIGKDEFYLTYMANEALSKRGRYELSFNFLCCHR